MIQEILKMLPGRWFGAEKATEVDPPLFEGDDEEFKRLARGCRLYGEYGCGASTTWVATNANCGILSVDTSMEWIDRVRASVPPGRAGVELHHADLGAVQDWGRPKTYERHERFPEYAEWMWRRASKPDLVLIDGRFRVCCFLTAMLHADPGTVIVFDDYTDRPHYHIVEDILAPSRCCGRQAVFERPSLEASDEEAIRRWIERFRFVFD